MLMDAKITCDRSVLKSFFLTEVVIKATDNLV